MEFKYQRKVHKRSELEAQIKSLLGKKSEFEVCLKSIEALFNFANGIKQAANIQNASLSQKAKDGLQYLQDIGQLIQDIKELKRLNDNELDAIEQTEYQNEMVEFSPEPEPPKSDIV